MMKSKTAAHAIAGGKGASAALPDWMTFPHLMSAFDPSPARVIEILEQKRERLQNVASAAVSPEQINARVIVGGYTRVIALLQEIEASRREHAANNEI